MPTPPPNRTLVEIIKLRPETSRMLSAVIDTATPEQLEAMLITPADNIYGSHALLQAIQLDDIGSATILIGAAQNKFDLEKSVAVLREMLAINGTAPADKLGDPLTFAMNCGRPDAFADMLKLIDSLNEDNPTVGNRAAFCALKRIGPARSADKEAVQRCINQVIRRADLAFPDDNTEAIGAVITQLQTGGYYSALESFLARLTNPEYLTRPAAGSSTQAVAPVVDARRVRLITSLIPGHTIAQGFQTLAKVQPFNAKYFADRMNNSADLQENLAALFQATLSPEQRRQFVDQLGAIFYQQRQTPAVEATRRQLSENITDLTGPAGKLLLGNLVPPKWAANASQGHTFQAWAQKQLQTIHENTGVFSDGTLKDVIRVMTEDAPSTPEQFVQEGIENANAKGLKLPQDSPHFFLLLLIVGRACHLTVESGPQRLRSVAIGDKPWKAAQFPVLFGDAGDQTEPPFATDSNATGLIDLDALLVDPDPMHTAQASSTAGRDTQHARAAAEQQAQGEQVTVEELKQGLIEQNQAILARLVKEGHFNADEIGGDQIKQASIRFIGDKLKEKLEQLTQQLQGATHLPEAEANAYAASWENEQEIATWVQELRQEQALERDGAQSQKLQKYKMQ